MSCFKRTNFKWPFAIHFGFSVSFFFINIHFPNKSKQKLLKFSRKQLKNDAAWSVSTLKLVQSLPYDLMQSRLFRIHVQIIRFWGEWWTISTQTSFGTALNNTSPMSVCNEWKHSDIRRQMSGKFAKRSTFWVEFHSLLWIVWPNGNCCTHIEFTVYCFRLVFEWKRLWNAFESPKRYIQYTEKDLKVLSTNLKCGTRIPLSDRMLMIRLKNICFMVLHRLLNRNENNPLLWLCSNYMDNIKPDLWFWL